MKKTEGTGFPVSTATVSTGGFKIIFKNAKIHAEKVIIKREKPKKVISMPERAEKNSDLKLPPELLDLLTW